LLHFTLPILRILLLVILFFALINPVVTYTTVTSADEVREDQPTSTSLLLSTPEYVNPPSGLGLTVRRTYGTLDETTNSPVQRAPSPNVPDHVASKIQVRLYAPLLSNGLLIPRLQSVPKEKDADTDPTWSELFRRIGHIAPYLWPKKNRTLQLLAVCPDFLS
jgi:ATP-binding cassette subfamily B (MDR/TAP) protein 6